MGATGYGNGSREFDRDKLMAVKDWLDTGKCLLGFHQGDWRPESPARCVMIQTCQRCGNVNTRVEHSWSDWNHASAQSCERSRRCTHCAESEKRTEHTWEAWSYHQDGSCQQSKRCRICSEWNDESRIEHQWGFWEYSERYRAPLHSCSRCGISASYFADQKVDEDELSSTNGDGARKELQELLTDDRGIEELLVRAEQRAGSSEPDVSPAAGPDDDTSDWRQQMGVLHQMYQGLIASGQIGPERQAFLTSILAELEAILGSPAPGLADKQIRATRVQQLLSQMSDAFLHPSRAQPVEEPVAGSSRAALTELHANLHRYVMTETSAGLLTGEEGKALMALMGRLRGSREALANPPSSADPVKVETEVLRPLALEVRNFSLRHHLTLAQPVWPSRAVGQHANALFYSGGSQIGALVAQVCASRQLRCLVPQADREPTSLRWDQLRESAVAVFDFTGYKRAASLEEASPIAAVAYELGIALALGRAAVVVATDGQELPFDLDIEPVCLNNDDSDVANLSAAFDRALYGLQRGAAGSSVKSSIKYLRDRFAGHPSPHVRMSLETVDDDATADPIKARHLITSTSGFLGAEALHILLPPWPGQYPDTSNKRCFHVTAFGPTWANSTRRLVGDACGSQIEYIRGDGVLAPDILRSIWDEICLATHVVVDLTGLNANVVLELGMAHTLGRNVLLISQDQQVERYFRAIAKHRIHPYTLDTRSDAQPLAAILQRFLA
jgi:hypothetical protein